MSGFDFELDADDTDLPEVDDPKQTVKLDCGPCHKCSRKFPGSDRNGGHCSTCHLSFASQTGFDKHRVGQFENHTTGKPNTRRCLTPEEMLAKGWTVDEHFVVRMPAPTHWKTREETA